ncbi:MAG: hypothetical protein DHS20C19_26960 [Acidimicrobiales bacterium]|nr:MAG: hypothetical protein DHS20C19_26960 [Acidimicrobiales bacterium]
MGRMAQTVAPDAFEQKLAEIAEREDAERARKAMWRAHHHADQYDRCVVIGGKHWCRRCLTLYPVTAMFAALSLAGIVLWPDSLDLWFIWLPCIPATLDFVLEQLGVIRYSARRQFLTTLLVAPALGRGFGHELDDSWSWEFWGPILCFCTIWFVAAVIGHRRTATTATA